MLKICEIVRLQSMTPVAEMPSCVRGVVDLHGKWIPVVDLRAQSGASMEESGCIIITKCEFVSNGPVEVGVIVDALDQIARIEIRVETSDQDGSLDDLESAADSKKLNEAICAWSKKGYGAELAHHN